MSYVTIVIGFLIGWFFRGIAQKRSERSMRPLVRMPFPEVVTEGTASAFALAHPDYALSIIERFPSCRIVVLNQINSRVKFQILDAHPEFIADRLRSELDHVNAIEEFPIFKEYCCCLARHSELIIDWLKEGSRWNSHDLVFCLLRADPSLAIVAAEKFPQYSGEIAWRYPSAFPVSAIKADDLPVPAVSGDAGTNDLPRAIVSSTPLTAALPRSVK